MKHNKVPVLVDMSCLDGHAKHYLWAMRYYYWPSPAQFLMMFPTLREYRRAINDIWMVHSGKTLAQFRDYVTSCIILTQTPFIYGVQYV